MYEVSERFTQALENGDIQHIRGKFRPLDSNLDYEFYEDEIVGTPTYDRQCVTDESTFMFGELYTGTLEMQAKINDPQYEGRLFHARISLETGFIYADGSKEFVPLGAWWVSECTRSAVGILNIKAVDCVSMLNVQFPMFDGSAGMWRMKDAMAQVEETAGIRFAQTAEEMTEESGINVNGCFMTVKNGEKFTCRQLVAEMAQILGCFAYADRFGQIAFRRCGHQTGYKIDPDRRFSVRLSDYDYAVKAVEYITQTAETWHVDTGQTAPNGINATLIFSENRFIFSNTSDYSYYLPPIAQNLNLKWTSGELSFYGNPCIDLGDMIELTFTDSTSKKILVTSDHWQFRGPQTLISAGAKERGTTEVSAGTTAATYQQIQYNTTKTVRTLAAECFEGRSTDTPTEFAFCEFRTTGETAVFVSVTANLSADTDCTAELRILVDGIKQTVQAVETIHANERKTLSVTAPFTLSSGIHTVTVETVGNFIIDRLNCDVTGQEIEEITGTDTYPKDYEFYQNEDGVTVTNYIGTALNPRIPAYLDGGAVRVLGESSFTESAVNYVSIPDGTEVIE